MEFLYAPLIIFVLLLILSNLGNIISFIFVGRAKNEINQFIENDPELRKKRDDIQRITRQQYLRLTLMKYPFLSDEEQKNQFIQMYHNFVKSFGEDKFKQWEQMRKNNPKKFKQEMKKHDSLVLFMKERYDIQEPTDFETMFDLYEQKLKDDELMSRNLKK